MLATLLLMLYAQAEDGFPYEVQRDDLANGLRLYTVPMPSPGIVALTTLIETGSRDEVDEGRTGFAHFFEHLMFYGTDELPRIAREQETFRMGVEENAWTWLDETNYHVTMSAEHLPRYFQIEADRFMNLRLMPEDVRREAGAVYGEFRKSLASPGSRLSQELITTAFTRHTYRHDTIGYEADIAAMPDAYEYAMSFFDLHYRPENAFVLVVGDVDHDEVLEQVKATYGSWERGSQPAPIIEVEPPQQGMRTAHVEWETPTATRMVHAWKIPAAGLDAERGALELLGSLLFASTGPLKTRLVREEGLCYAVYGGADDFVDPRFFSITTQVKEGVEPAVVEAAIREELQKVAQEVDPKRLEAVKERMRNELMLSLDNPQSTADFLSWFLRRNPDPDDLKRAFALVDAVAAKDVSAAARRWLLDDTLTRVTLAHGDAPVFPDDPTASTVEDAP
jgi:zinc protease